MIFSLTFINTLSFDLINTRSSFFIYFYTSKSINIKFERTILDYKESYLVYRFYCFY